MDENWDFKERLAVRAAEGRPQMELAWVKCKVSVSVGWVRGMEE